MVSPFVFGKVASGGSFTDRSEELKRLSANIHSRINTVLISPRRWGKSSLVAETGRLHSGNDDSVRFCFIDFFNVRTEQEFYAAFAGEVLRVSFTGWEERLEGAKKFFKRLRPSFTVGADPAQEFSVRFDLDDIQRSPDEVLDLPELIATQKGITFVVCIDEFQNLSYFEQPAAFQKKLRSHWQHHRQTTYCLYGSKRHMMAELFENSSMPFYKFGDVMFLEKIPETYWVPYIVERFRSSGKSIDEAQATAIARTMENHPYFVQQLSHSAWTQTTTRCSRYEVERALDDLFTHHTILFQREIDGMTNNQVNFLRALSDNVEQLSAAKTLHAYHLGSSANVGRIKDSLVHKDILDLFGSRIEFLDPLFKLWFSAVYMKRGLPRMGEESETTA